jgi:hypothetical protein
MEFELTTDHPASSYNIPVLIVDGIAHGSLDKLPNGELAWYFVQALPESDLRLKFLKSSPDLYFNL